MLLNHISRDIMLNLLYKRRVKKLINKYKLAEISIPYCKASFEPVSVIIPAIDKDVEILPLVVDSLHKNISHKIDSISVIAPNSTIIRELCESKSLNFIDESKLLPIQKKDIKYTCKNLDRSGWMFQQLLKIAGALNADTEKILICDADTVFVRKQVFYSDVGIYYDIPIENHKHYKDAYEKLTGLVAPNYSTTAHHILLEKSMLKELLALIEKNMSKEWWLAICDTISCERSSCHSDYDTIGFYAINKSPFKSYLRYGENGTFKRKNVWIRKIPGISLIYRTISFHSYNK